MRKHNPLPSSIFARFQTWTYSVEKPAPNGLQPPTSSHIAPHLWRGIRSRLISLAEIVWECKHFFCHKWLPALFWRLIFCHCFYLPFYCCFLPYWHAFFIAKKHHGILPNIRAPAFRRGPCSLLMGKTVCWCLSCGIAKPLAPVLLRLLPHLGLPCGCTVQIR